MFVSLLKFNVYFNVIIMLIYSNGFINSNVICICSYDLRPPSLSELTPYKI